MLHISIELIERKISLNIKNNKKNMHLMYFRAIRGTELLGE